MNNPPHASEVALILAPSFNDGALAEGVLRSAGIESHACASVTELCEAAGRGCGAMIISEEALTWAAISQIHEFLETQESWSDLPIILLTNSDVVKATEVFSKTGNIFLLERPFSRLTLIRSVEVALRSRIKQYQVRDLLEALKKSKDEAERANLAKSQFLANMSHEIRTPIGVIMGFVDLIRKSEDPSKAMEYMGIVDRNSQHLLRLIDDILDLSKVEAGKMSVEHIEFALGEFLSDVLFNMNFKAMQKGIDLRILVSGQVPDRVLSDPGRLRQILTNVIGNAIKFTERGFVEFDVSFEAGILKMRVSDTGVGLNANQIANLFQPFVQADSSTTRKFGGTGLGLLLSKRLAEALGGDIELLQSEAGRGSAFEIRIRPEVPRSARLSSDLALMLRPQERSSRSVPQVLYGLKMLVVDDSPDNQELISTYLRKAGGRVEVATNGAEGIRAALSEDFDLILMDLQMPVMDGHQATQELRRRAYPKPILALTAHAMNEEKERCFVSGFTDYITKPIDFEMLIKTLASYREGAKNSAHWDRSSAPH